MKFICLGYFDQAKFDLIPKVEQEGFMGACFAYDEELIRGGHFAGGHALMPPNHAVTVRPAAGKTVVTDGPYTETKELLGGILILEARDLNHAIDLMLKHPGVRAGGFEIRPSNAEIEAIFPLNKAKASNKD